jgi:hypothetical protein
MRQWQARLRARADARNVITCDVPQVMTIGLTAPFRLARFGTQA